MNNHKKDNTEYYTHSMSGFKTEQEASKWLETELKLWLKVEFWFEYQTVEKLDGRWRSEYQVSRSV